MLDSTFELFTLAASNSLAVFCFCNIIIGIILVSGSCKSNESSPFPGIIDDESHKKYAATSSTGSIKPSKDDRLSSLCMADESGPSVMITRDDELFKKNAVHSSENADESKKSDEKLWSVSISMDEIIEEEMDIADEEDDDELRKRVEEFIEKINRGWRDEKLKTFS